MRVYGTSPLFNYVELVFRCKRMFILSIVLGTAIIAVVVHTRAATYEARIVVTLVGAPDAVSTSQAENLVSPATRKAQRLGYWIQRTPDFLEQVVTDAGLLPKHPDMGVSDLAREVRKKLQGPEVLNNQFMEVSISWPNPEEAETIMNRLFSRFNEKTLAIETFQSSQKRQVLDTQIKEVDAAWNQAATQRNNYIRAHSNAPTADNISAADQAARSANRALGNARLEYNEARDTLAKIDGMLRTTPQYIEASTEATVQNTSDLGFQMTQIQDLKRQKAVLLQSYSELHPKVQDINRQIDAAQKAYDDAKKQEANPKRQQIPSSVTTKKQINSDWQDLHTKQAAYQQALIGLQRRIADLTQDARIANDALKNGNSEQTAFAVISRNYDQASQQRAYVQAQLSQARLDEARDKITQSQIVKLDVPPKAERTDSGGKMALLYAVGPFMGILIAFVFSLAAEALDHTLRTPVEVEKFLGKPVLAVIPQMNTPKIARKQLAGADRKRIAPRT